MGGGFRPPDGFPERIHLIEKPWLVIWPEPCTSSGVARRSCHETLAASLLGGDQRGALFGGIVAAGPCAGSRRHEPRCGPHQFDEWPGVGAAGRLGRVGG